MWIFWALLSALSAALVTIFAKLGLATLDSVLATTVRAIIMASFLVIMSLALKKFHGFSASSLSSREWVLIVLAGIVGATSWLFYFLALKTGPASAVGALDRLSLVFIVFLSALVLGESLTWRTALGSLLAVGGVLLITLK